LHLQHLGGSEDAAVSHDVLLALNTNLVRKGPPFKPIDMRGLIGQIFAHQFPFSTALH